MKCAIKVAARVKPAEGTTANGKGTCPKCKTPGVVLSSRGFIGAHVVSVAPVSLPQLPHTVPPVAEARPFIGPKREPLPPVIAESALSEAELTEAIKARSTSDVSGKPDPGLVAKCAIDGEPIKVKHKIAPVVGSIRGGKSDDPKDDGKIVIDATGTCPECRAHLPLSNGGFIPAHNVRKGPIPAAKTLVETSIEPADMGSRVGDPEAGSKRRATEIDGAFQRGTVEIPQGDEMAEVPATLENLRIAFTYWTEREPRKESAKAEQTKMILMLRRRIDAAMAGTAMVHGKTSGETDVNRGAAIIKGVTPTQTAEQWARSQARKDRRFPNPGRSTTMDQPTGMERVDRVVTVGTEFEIAGGKYGHLTRAELGKKSNTQRRRYWRIVKERQVKAEGKPRHNARAAATREIAPSVIGRSTYANGKAMESDPGKNGKVKRNTK